MGDGQVHGRIVSDFAAEWTTAWNSHDMKAFADLFHDDAAFVNVNGMYAHGRDEIQRQNETVHAGFFRNSTLVMQVEDARWPVADVIVAHASSEVRGDERAPGQVRHTILTIIIERRNDEWKISAAHNTNIVPPAG
jgi:uncharacterized protein (TIGR02246 family)